MRPMLRIRKVVLQLTQAEMAALTGARQATVSRWERGELEPDREQLALIRTEARRKGIAWDDRWFFESSAKTKRPLSSRRPHREPARAGAAG